MDKRRKVVHKVPVVKEVAKMTQTPVAQCSFIYDVMMEIMLKKLKTGTDVLLPGIGRISLKNTKGQKSHLTGQFIPPHKRVVFAPNVKLARYVRVHTREYPIK